MTSALDYMFLEKHYGANNYNPLPIVIRSAKGVYVWDTDGNRYIDMMGAYSSQVFGHGDEGLLDALVEQANRVAVPSRAYYNNVTPIFMQKLARLTGLPKVLPMNTGAEAVETAIKAARRWGYKQGIEEGLAEIIVCKNNFHGRTTTISGFSSDHGNREGFGPFTGGFHHVEFGNIHAMNLAIASNRDNVCAILIEPIQGEAGVIVPYEGYLHDLRAMCSHYRIMLIIDEVQSGFGRTGATFAFQHEGIKPDGLILGKALGGGLLPVSALVGTHELMEVFTPNSHGSTFGGNPLACAVAIEVIDRFAEHGDGINKHSSDCGEYIINRVKMWRSPVVKSVRGKGLWIGLEINPEYATARVACELLLDHGVMSKETHGTVVRLAPPLNITWQELQDAMDRIEIVIRNLESRR